MTVLGVFDRNENYRFMKMIDFTFNTLLITLILSVIAPSTISAMKFDAMPLDTIKEKVVKGLFFEETYEEKSIVDTKDLEEEEEASKVIVYRSKAKILPRDYSGYGIQLFVVYHKPLEANDPLFKEYGNLLVEKIGENGYSYILKVEDFRTKKGLDAFNERVIRPKFKNAKALKYKNGVRVRF